MAGARYGTLVANMRRAQGTANVPNRTVLRIANVLRACPKTVRKVIDGQPVRGRVEGEIRRLLDLHQKREQERQRRRVLVPAGGSDGTA